MKKTEKLTTSYSICDRLLDFSNNPNEYAERVVWKLITQTVWPKSFDLRLKIAKANNGFMGVCCGFECYLPPKELQ